MTVGGHISGLTNGVSRGTDAQAYHEHDALVRCLSGRYARLQKCCRSLAAVPVLATVLGNTVC